MELVRIYRLLRKMNKEQKNRAYRLIKYVYIYTD